MRVAIVGAGLMGRWHAVSARRAGATVAAIVDPNVDRARALASRCGATARTGDVVAAVRDAGATIAHVCTPVETHDTLALELLEAGCDVLIEKPLTSSAESTETIVDLARSYGRLLCPVHQFVFQEGVQRALRTLPDLGTVLHIDAVACSAGADSRSERIRAAVAEDILPHPLSLVARFLGTGLERVEWHAHRSSAGELRALGVHENVHIGILVSMAGRPTRNNFVVTCTRGTLSIDLFHGFAVIERGNPSRAYKIWRPFGNGASLLGAAAANLLRRTARGESAYPGLRSLVREFYRAANGSRRPPISYGEIASVARARDKIIRSAPRLDATAPDGLPPNGFSYATV